ncbi:MAG: NotI family restriction endonuclease [Chloroflexaceae bacterium]
MASALMEVQAVYISGNVRKPFSFFMHDPDRDLDWSGQKDYPRPDDLSSSRKRLVPQLIPFQIADFGLQIAGVALQWALVGVQMRSIGIRYGFRPGYDSMPPAPS